MTKEVDWLPQDRQLVLLKSCGLSFPFTDIPFHTALADVIGYGGSAGGGKTDAMLMIALIASIVFPSINIGYFRRNFPQLEGPGGAMLRSRYLYEGLGRLADKRWTMNNKSIIQFCHCSNPNDVFNYQSQQFDIMLFDEATQFTKDMVDYLLTRNRKTIKDERFKPFAVMGTNPGGVGHNFFKERFVKLPTVEEPHEYTYDSGVVLKHLFIPSRLTDNQILVERDPGYSNRIGTNELNRKMLLDGNWDVFAGQAFGELSRSVHVIPPFEIPDHWNRYGSYDHGFNHPFSYQEWAVDMDGVAYCYRHIKDRLKRPDEIARMIGDTSRLKIIWAGRDCWTRGRDGAISIAEQFSNSEPRIVIAQAIDDRISGSSVMRNMIAWKNKNGDGTDGKPRVYFFENCLDVYDNISERIFDPNRPEDVLKEDADDQGVGGDDIYDSSRYFLASRFSSSKPKEDEEKKNTAAYLHELAMKQNRFRGFTR